MNKSENGFSVVEAILILVTVGIISSVAWYVFHGKITSSPQSTTPTTTGTSNVPTSNVYNGWKTYKSPAEGFSIKYPSDWTLKTGTTNSNGVFDSSLDGVSISGPNDFTIGYDVMKPVTSSTCANCSFTLLDTIKLKNNQPGYIVISSNTYNNNIEEQSLSISKAKTYKEQSDQGWPYYSAFVTSDKFVRWSGSYSGVDKTKCGGAGCEPVSMSLSDFRSRAEVKTAEQILQSLSY
jgi:hypothetical protein